MSKIPGRSLPLSPFRRLVIDLMHFSAKVPSVTVERRMNLARLVLARQACVPRPSWSVLFTKGFAMVAGRTPELRRSYMSFPWARFYEHPCNIATLNIDRMFGKERIVIYAHVRRPENRSLTELDVILRSFKERPLDEIDSFCTARRLGRCPYLLRRFIWWGALNIFGRRRCHNFGTFGITSVASLGAGILNLVPILTSTLHYGLLDDQGCLDMRLAFDHRVLDGATAALALVDLESVLLNEILKEVLHMQVRSAAA